MMDEKKVTPFTVERWGALEIEGTDNDQQLKSHEFNKLKSSLAPLRK
jgi:hypothetical protein